MMRKILLTSFLSLLAFTQVNAQNVNIPDANFKAYLVGNTGINTNNDGEISNTEAAAFTGMIKCDNLFITDLTGIEAFTFLTHLHCNNNQLTNLNVSTNTALIRLVCNDNQITNLNVSTNTALTQLQCYNNQLTNLNISTNTALTDLRCDYNQITNLDVSTNTELTYLSVPGNQLTSLAVSTNTELVYLYCATNQLTSLDVSINTALKTLYCFDNLLTNLDVSTNTALEILNKQVLIPQYEGLNSQEIVRTLFKRDLTCCVKCKKGRMLSKLIIKASPS